MKKSSVKAAVRGVQRRKANREQWKKNLGLILEVLRIILSIAGLVHTW